MRFVILRAGSELVCDEASAKSFNAILNNEENLSHGVSRQRLRVKFRPVHKVRAAYTGMSIMNSCARSTY